MFLMSFNEKNRILAKLVNMGLSKIWPWKKIIHITVGWRVHIMASYLLLMTFLINRIQALQHWWKKCVNNKGNYEVHMISFQTFFVWAFKIAVDSWKLLLLYILWNDWPIFMISGSNEQLQQQLEYTLLKPDCHSWWISKMQRGHL